MYVLSIYVHYAIRISQYCDSHVLNVKQKITSISYIFSIFLPPPPYNPETHLPLSLHLPFLARIKACTYTLTYSQPHFSSHIFIFKTIKWDHLQSWLRTFVGLDRRERGSKSSIVGNVYAPSTDDSAFFFFFSSLSNLSDCPIILAGDFSTVLAPTIDKSDHSQNKRIWQSTKTIKQFMSDFGLVDSCRLQHPDSTEYSFFLSTTLTPALITS